MRKYSLIKLLYFRIELRFIQSFIDEKNILLYNIFSALKPDVWLSNPLILDGFRKLEVLNVARECGIDIPTTLITNSKEELLKFKDQIGEIIVKPINEAINFDADDVGFLQYTCMVSRKMIEELDLLIFPSLFQECLRKDYEIRSFFLNGKFYSMAIFSQEDEQTRIDFRRYNTKKPNRTIPYNLPTRVEDNLCRLMDKLELNTGSLDIVKTMSGRYVFLEVNPVGQYGMVSKPCNYYLEKKVAQYLIEMKKPSNYEKKTIH